MPGPKPCTITKADNGYARRYIDNAMQRGNISTFHGHMAFKKPQTADALQAWREKTCPVNSDQNQKCGPQAFGDRVILLCPRLIEDVFADYESEYNRGAP